MHCHILSKNAECYTFAEKIFSWAIPNLYARHSQWGICISRGENLLKRPEKNFLFLCIKKIHKHTVIQYAAKSLQSYPTLCDPIDSSPPGSPVPGILQVKTLEWVAISFSNA